MKLTGLSKKDKQKYSLLNLKGKLKLSKKIVSDVFKEFDSRDLAIAATGGKDSTVLLWIVKQVVEEKKLPFPAKNEM